MANGVEILYEHQPAEKIYSQHTPVQDQRPLHNAEELPKLVK